MSSSFRAKRSRKRAKAEKEDEKTLRHLKKRKRARAREREREKFNTNTKSGLAFGFRGLKRGWNAVGACLSSRSFFSREKKKDRTTGFQKRS